jgi:hypothetical protein
MLNGHNGQKLEDTKGVIRFRKSKKDRQHNGKKLEKTTKEIRNSKSKKLKEHKVVN